MNINVYAQQMITGTRRYLAWQRDTARYWTSSGHPRVLPNGAWDPMGKKKGLSATDIRLLSLEILLI